MQRMPPAPDSSLAPAPGTLSTRTLVLASLGGALEFYDFIVYGIFAASIGAEFFPASDPLVSLILSFSVFAVGYLARPLGGLVLGSLGDRAGRRMVFLRSLGAISVVTLAIGLLPGYATFGVLAPVLLVLLRLLQGFCLGGELPGAIVYVAETAGRRRGFGGGVLFACVNAGVLAATLVSLGLHTWLNASSLALYGWRIAFGLGGVAGLLGLLLRRQLGETPAFAAIRATHARLPLAELLRGHGRAVTVGVLACAVVAGFNGLLFAHLPAHLVRVLHVDPARAAWAQTICLLVTSAAMVGVGWLGDRMPRRWLLRAGSALMALGGIGFYAAIARPDAKLSGLFALAGLAAALANGSFAAILGDLFLTRVRFSGVALSLNIGFTLFSGLAPLAATSLTRATGWDAAPGLFLAGCGALSFAASLLLPKAGVSAR